MTDQEQAGLTEAIGRDLAAARAAATSEERWGLLRDAEWLPQVPLQVVLGDYRWQLSAAELILYCTLPAVPGGYGKMASQATDQEHRTVRVLGNFTRLQQTTNGLHSLLALPAEVPPRGIELRWMETTRYWLDQVDEDAREAYHDAAAWALLCRQEGGPPAMMAMKDRLTITALNCTVSAARAARAALLGSLACWDNAVGGRSGEYLPLERAARREGCRALCYYENLRTMAKEAYEAGIASDRDQGVRDGQGHYWRDWTYRGGLEPHLALLRVAGAGSPAPLAWLEGALHQWLLTSAFANLGVRWGPPVPGE